MDCCDFVWSVHHTSALSCLVGISAQNNDSMVNLKPGNKHHKFSNQIAKCFGQRRLSQNLMYMDKFSLWFIIVPVEILGLQIWDLSLVHLLCLDRTLSISMKVFHIWTLISSTSWWPTGTEPQMKHCATPWYKQKAVLPNNCRHWQNNLQNCHWEMSPLLINVIWCFSYFPGNIVKVGDNEQCKTSASI